MLESTQKQSMIKETFIHLFAERKYDMKVNGEEWCGTYQGGEQSSHHPCGSERASDGGSLGRQLQTVAAAWQPQARSKQRCKQSYSHH